MRPGFDVGAVDGHRPVRPPGHRRALRRTRPPARHQHRHGPAHLPADPAPRTESRHPLDRRDLVLHGAARTVTPHRRTRPHPDRRRESPLRDLFDKRRPYEMRPLTAPTEGVQRLRGPARRGKLRCPNVPKSMRAPHTTPLTGCTKNQPCGCGRTVTVHCGDHRRDRQRLPWQSTDGSTPTGAASASSPSTPRSEAITPPSTAATSASSASPRSPPCSPSASPG